MDTEGLKQKVRVLEEENKLLQQRLEFLEDAFDHLPQQLWILSESGELLYTSQSMREVLGSLGCGEGMNIYTWLSKSPYRATEQMISGRIL